MRQQRIIDQPELSADPVNQTQKLTLQIQSEPKQELQTEPSTDSYRSHDKKLSRRKLSQNQYHTIKTVNHLLQKLNH